MIFRDERERKKQMKVEREWGREREREQTKKEIRRFGGDGGAVIAEKVERR